MSRKLGTGAGLLFICGFISLFFGSYSTFSLSTIMISNEDLLGMPITEIQELNPKLVDYIERYHQLYGLYLLSFGLFLCIVSLKPYRNGEKWAWYSTLIIGGVTFLGTLLLSRKMVAVRLTLLLIVLWVAALALPAQETLNNTERGFMVRR